MSFTVTAAESGTTFAGVLLQVRVITGQAANPIGANAFQSGAAGHQASITTTKAGSLVYAAAATASLGAWVANANTTTLASQADAVNGLDTATGKSAAATVTPGAVIIGWSSPTAAGGAALLEIVPAGASLTEDASSPVAAYSGSAATSVTTAAFNPPLGSVLVAMVAADASTATVLNLSDTSGLSLTWTQQVVAQTLGNLYAAVWTAVMPAPPAVAAAAVQGGGRSMLKRSLMLADL